MGYPAAGTYTYSKHAPSKAPGQKGSWGTHGVSGRLALPRDMGVLLALEMVPVELELCL